MSLFNKQKIIVKSTVQRPASNHKQVGVLSNSMLGVRITSQRYPPTFEPTEPWPEVLTQGVGMGKTVEMEQTEPGNGESKEATLKLIAISGMSNNPNLYTQTVKARANLAHATFSRANVLSYYYDEGSNGFTIPLSPALNAYNEGLSEEWKGSSESNRLLFVTGNIGSKVGVKLGSDVTGTVDKFGQGPGFNFTPKQMESLGLSVDTTINDKDAVRIPVATWRQIFDKYGEAQSVSNSSLGAMITSLFGDHFFNQNKHPLEDGKAQYKRTNWSNEQATNFMLLLSNRLTGEDRENILANYRTALTKAVSTSGFSKDTVELIHQPLANLRAKHASVGMEIAFLEKVNAIAIEMLATIGCSALEYDGLAVHCALLCMHYKAQGMNYNFNSLIEGTTTTIKQVCQQHHQDVVLWSVGLRGAEGELGGHIANLMKGGTYIKGRYQEVLFYHDLGLDPNLDDFIAINLLIKTLGY